MAQGRATGSRPTGFAWFMVVCLVGVLVAGLVTHLRTHVTVVRTAAPVGSVTGPLRASAAAAPTHASAHAAFSLVPEGSPAGSAPSTTAATTTTTAPAPTACTTNPAGAKALVVSIASQTLWACDGTDVVNTSPVTTGADGATPTGTWAILAKEGPQYLDGCSPSGCWHDFVHVWIPFWGPYGFHDAPWQTMPFGSPGYTTQGSHGCVHLPEAEAAWVESWAAIGTRVTIV